MSIQENLIHKNHSNLINNYFLNEDKILIEITNSISNFLYCELEIKKYSVYRTEFEADCRRALGKIFKELFNQENNFLIFPDIIPGFTTITYKKNPEIFKKIKEKNAKLDLSKLKKNNQSSTVINSILDSFFQKNNNTVLLIDSKDLLLAFCPVNDYDEYIKENILNYKD